MRVVLKEFEKERREDCVTKHASVWVRVMNKGSENEGEWDLGQEYHTNIRFRTAAEDVDGTDVRALWWSRRGRGRDMMSPGEGSYET